VTIRQFNERVVKSSPEDVERRRRLIEAKMALQRGVLPSALQSVTRALEPVGETPSGAKRAALLREAWANVGAEQGGAMAERIVRNLAEIAANPEALTNAKFQQGAIMAAQTLASMDRSMGKHAVEDEGGGGGAPQITVVFEERPGGRPLPERGVQATNGRTIDVPRIER